MKKTSKVVERLTWRQNRVKAIRYLNHVRKGEITMDQNETKSLDVRQMPPAQRHPTIFRTFDELAVGQSFILVNDHDPKPLYYQLLHEREGQFNWEYQEEGPETWRVQISRTAPA